LIEQTSGQNWNVLCHSASVTTSYVPVKSFQYIYFKPYSCYYTAYVIANS
jgi:hypothetical protein